MIIPYFNLAILETETQDGTWEGDIYFMKQQRDKDSNSSLNDLSTSISLDHSTRNVGLANLGNSIFYLNKLAILIPSFRFY